MTTTARHERHPGLHGWLNTGDRGLSSEAIAWYMTTGAPPADHPYDPSDFRRCELLLRAVPTFRPRMPELGQHSRVWARLVAQWDQIVALMETEAPGCFDGGRPRRGQAAPRAYELIRAARTGATA